MGTVPGSHAKQKVEESVERSVKELRGGGEMYGDKSGNGVQIDTLFLHLPDRSTSAEETARAMHEQVMKGRCKRWGVSNHSVEEVRSLLRVSSERGWVGPSV